MELNKLKGELLLHSSKNELLTVSLKKEKVMKKVKLPYELKDEIATNILSIDKNLFIGFPNGSVYEISKTTKNIFLGFAPIISLDKFNNSLLVTDYDGNITLLNLSKETK